MTLRELLADTDIPFVVDYMRDMIEDGIHVINIELMKTKISNLLNQLLTLPSIPSNISSIAVVKVADTDVYNNIYYYYDAICIDKDNNEYSIMGVDVRKMLDTNIHQPSIDFYDIQSVISTIILEITWFGYSIEDIDANRCKFNRELLEAIEETQTENAYSIDIPTISQHEKEEMQERILECVMLNKQEYKKLGLVKQ